MIDDDSLSIHELHKRSIVPGSEEIETFSQDRKQELVALARGGNARHGKPLKEMGTEEEQCAFLRMHYALAMQLLLGCCENKTEPQRKPLLSVGTRITYVRLNHEIQIDEGKDTGKMLTSMLEETAHSLRARLYEPVPTEEPLDDVRAHEFFGMLARRIGENSLSVRQSEDLMEWNSTEIMNEERLDEILRGLLKKKNRRRAKRPCSCTYNR